MTINAVDYGPRNGPQILDLPRRWTSFGVSQAAVVTVVDHAHTEQDIPVKFSVMSATNKDTLKTYLMTTIKPGGAVSVTPDTGDDLGIGASGAVSLTFISFDATWIYGTNWEVNILFRKYA